MALKNIKYAYATIAVFCFIAFYPILKGDFMGYDDPYYILDNQYIKSFSFHNIMGICSGKAIDLYIPVTIFFQMFEYIIFGPNAKSFHLISLILHILNAILLLNLFVRLRIKNNVLIYILLVFFALSPLTCESVCWITEQKDLLYTAFFILSAIQFIKFQQEGLRKNIFISLLYFVLACLSKPMAISLPVLFLIYLVYTEHKIDFKKYLVLILFFIVSILIAWISIFVIKKEAEYKIPDYSVFDKMFLVLAELGYYFFKPFLPINQQLINPFPAENAVFDNQTIVLFALLALMLFCGIIYTIFKSKNRTLAALFFSWLVFLSPILQLIPNTHAYVSERYFYVSIIFPAAMVLILALEFELLKKNLTVVFYALLVVFTFLSFKRSGFWVNTKVMFTQELKVEGNDANALNNLGYYYNSVQEYLVAGEYLQQAIALDTNNAIYLNNYGWTLSGLNLTDSAIVLFKMAIDKKPNFVKALNNLGICYGYQRNWKNAYQCFNKAYSFDAENAETLYNIGLYYISNDEIDRGRTFMQRAYAKGDKGALKYLK